MLDPNRRKVLKTGAAAAIAATSSVLAQQAAAADTGRFYQRGNVRIHYEEKGSGFPLLIIAGDKNVILAEAGIQESIASSS